MTAIEDARAALADLRAGIPQRGDYPEYDREHEDLDKIAALIAEHEYVLKHPLLATVDMNDSAVIEVPDGSVSTPPADDEHEALEGLASSMRLNHRQVMTDPEGMVWSCICGDWAHEQFDAHQLRVELPRAGFRRQGPITDEAVVAAMEAWSSEPLKLPGEDAEASSRRYMRAALEAARGA